MVGRTPTAPADGQRPRPRRGERAHIPQTGPIGPSLESPSVVAPAQGDGRTFPPTWPIGPLRHTLAPARPRPGGRTRLPAGPADRTPSPHPRPCSSPPGGTNAPPRRSGRSNPRTTPRPDASRPGDDRSLAGLTPRPRGERADGTRSHPRGPHPGLPDERRGNRQERDGRGRPTAALLGHLGRGAAPCCALLGPASRLALPVLLPRHLPLPGSWPRLLSLPCPRGRCQTPRPLSNTCSTRSRASATRSSPGCR
ncbi:hypothetical protein ABIB53_000861 [Janibacter sp. UYMM211]